MRRLSGGLPGFWKYGMQVFVGGVALSFVGSIRAEAAITLYRLGKTQVYTQTSDSQPSAPSGFYGGFSMEASSGDDLTAARVSTTQSAPPREFVMNESQEGSWSNGRGYASLAEMDGDLPADDQLAFSIEGGLLGTQAASMTVPAANFFAGEVPYLTSSAFTTLNGIDTTAPFTVTWDGFAPVTGTNRAPIFFSIDRVSDNFTVFTKSFNNSAKWTQIPANALDPNTEYRANLTYSSRIVHFDAGFGTGDSEVLFDLLTNLTFKTAVFLPGDFNRDDIVDAADYTVWRDSLGLTYPSLYAGADGDGDMAVTIADYEVWKTHFNLVDGEGSAVGLPLPEPSQSLFLVFAHVLCRARRHRPGGRHRPGRR